MLRYVTARIDPEIAVSTTNADPAEIDDPTIVGDPAGCLSDDSDATYVAIPATGEVFVSTATGVLEPRRVTNDPDAGPIKARIRIKGPATGSRVTVQSTLLGEGNFAGSPTTVPPPTAEWVEFTLTENTPPFVGRPMDLLLPYLNGDATNYTMQLSVAALGSVENAPLYVYEAQILVPGPRRHAPPCQLFPNDVHGSVGGPVSQFPPSKSRQRGHRVGGGHY